MQKIMRIAALSMALCLALCGACASAEGNSILIAYFTAAENSGVDAVSSASVVEIDGTAKGVSQAVAEWIAERTGGDLFSIRTSTVYPAEFDPLADYAMQEQEEDARPELTTHIENLDQYDTIFVGFPIWWYEMPMVMRSFFDEYDFSGKTIIPFTVHRGSRLSGTPEVIQELEPNATVVQDGFQVYHENTPGAKADLDAWLTGLGY